MKRADLPNDPPQAPRATLPPGSCDAHLHMVAGPDVPLWEGRIEDPAEGSTLQWRDRLDRHLSTLGVERAVFVQSILYGTDNSLTLDTVARLGPGVARAVVLVTADVSEAELDRLAAAGAVGVRLNYVHGGVLDWDGAKRLAPRLAARGMHVQMLLHADRHIGEIASDIKALPVPIVIDHMGWPDLSAGLSEPGFRTMLALLAEGDIYVKLSGLYRFCDPPYTAAADAVAALMAANPDRCLWGSDWPHLMLAQAARPDAGVLLNSCLEVVTGADERARLFSGAPATLFGFP